MVTECRLKPRGIEYPWTIQVTVPNLWHAFPGLWSWILKIVDSTKCFYCVRNKSDEIGRTLDALKSCEDGYDLTDAANYSRNLVDIISVIDVVPGSPVPKIFNSFLFIENPECKEYDFTFISKYERISCTPSDIMGILYYYAHPMQYTISDFIYSKVRTDTSYKKVEWCSAINAVYPKVRQLDLDTTIMYITNTLKEIRAAKEYFQQFNAQEYLANTYTAVTSIADVYFTGIETKAHAQEYARFVSAMLERYINHVDSNALLAWYRSNGHIQY